MKIKISPLHEGLAMILVAVLAKLMFFRDQPTPLPIHLLYLFMFLMAVIFAHIPKVISDLSAPPLLISREEAKEVFDILDNTYRQSQQQASSPEKKLVPLFLIFVLGPVLSVGQSIRLGTSLNILQMFSNTATITFYMGAYIIFLDGMFQLEHIILKWLCCTNE
jgi:hypothetical protein